MPILNPFFTGSHSSCPWLSACTNQKKTLSHVFTLAHRAIVCTVCFKVCDNLGAKNNNLGKSNWTLLWLSNCSRQPQSPTQTLFPVYSHCNPRLEALQSCRCVANHFLPHNAAFRAPSVSLWPLTWSLKAACSHLRSSASQQDVDGRWVFAVCSDSCFLLLRRLWSKNPLRHLSLCSAGNSSVSAAGKLLLSGHKDSQRHSELPSKPSGPWWCWRGPEDSIGWCACPVKSWLWYFVPRSLFVRQTPSLKAHDEKTQRKTDWWSLHQPESSISHQG